MDVSDTVQGDARKNYLDFLQANQLVAPHLRHVLLTRTGRRPRVPLHLHYLAPRIREPVTAIITLALPRKLEMRKIHRAMDDDEGLTSPNRSLTQNIIFRDRDGN